VTNIQSEEAALRLSNINHLRAQLISKVKKGFAQVYLVLTNFLSFNEQISHYSYFLLM